jgi:DNA-binding NarL/FixJ family response regulator
MESAGMKKIHILLVEDHPIFRNGLLELINMEDDMEVTGETDNVPEAKEIIQKVQPHCAIVDISLTDSNGVDLVKYIKSTYPEVKVLVLSMHDELLYAERMLRAGALGYVMKQEAPEMILQAIRTVMENNVFVSDAISSTILKKIIEGKDGKDVSGVESLTEREKEIYTWIGRGSSTREIADALSVSIKTVENHRAHIKDKLGLKNSIELIQSATVWVMNESV